MSGYLRTLKLLHLKINMDGCKNYLRNLELENYIGQQVTLSQKEAMYQSCTLMIISQTIFVIQTYNVVICVDGVM